MSGEQQILVNITTNVYLLITQAHMHPYINACL